MSGNAHSNNLELKSIFNLFDQSNSGEIDIKQLNIILKNLDNLKFSSILESKKKIKENESNENFDKKLSSNENIEQGESNLALTLTNSEMENQENPLNFEKNESSIELKVFPNKKTAINFNEFSNIFNEALTSKDLQDELLLSCFGSFDYNKYKNNQNKYI